VDATSPLVSSDSGLLVVKLEGDLATGGLGTTGTRSLLSDGGANLIDHTTGGLGAPGVGRESAEVELGDVLLSDMELTLKVSEAVGGDVLVEALKVSDGLTGKLAGNLELGLGGEVHPTDLEVEVRTDVDELHVSGATSNTDDGGGLLHSVVTEAHDSVSLVSLGLGTNAVIGGGYDALLTILATKGDVDSTIDTIKADLGLRGSVEVIQEEATETDEEGLGVELATLEHEEGLATNGGDTGHILGELGAKGVHGEDS